MTHTISVRDTGASGSNVPSVTVTAATTSTLGPLAISSNPRYFALPDVSGNLGKGRAIFYTGSHIWTNGNQQVLSAYNGTYGSANSFKTTMTFQDNGTTPGFLSWFIAACNGTAIPGWIEAQGGNCDGYVQENFVPFLRSTTAGGLDGNKWDLTAYNTTAFNTWLADVRAAAAKGRYYQLRPHLMVGTGWTCDHGAGAGSLCNVANDITNVFWTPNNKNGCAPSTFMAIMQDTTGAQATSGHDPNTSNTNVWYWMTRYTAFWLDTFGNEPNCVIEIGGGENDGSANTQTWLQNMVYFIKQYQITNKLLKQPVVIGGQDGCSVGLTTLDANIQSTTWGINGTTNDGAFPCGYQNTTGITNLIIPSGGNNILFSDQTAAGSVVPCTSSKPVIIDTDHWGGPQYEAIDPADTCAVLFIRGFGGFLYMEECQGSGQGVPGSGPAIDNQIDPPYGNTYDGAAQGTSAQQHQFGVRTSIMATQTVTGLLNGSDLTPMVHIDSATSGASSTGFGMNDGTAQYVAYTGYQGASGGITFNPLPAGTWKYTWVNRTTGAASTSSNGTGTFTQAAAGKSQTFVPPSDIGTSPAYLVVTSTTPPTPQYLLLQTRLAPQYPPGQSVTDASSNTFQLNYNAQLVVNGTVDSNAAPGAVAQFAIIGSGSAQTYWYQNFTTGNWFSKTSVGGTWAQGNNPLPVGTAGRVANFLNMQGANIDQGTYTAAQNLSAIQYLNFKIARSNPAGNISSLAQNGIKFVYLVQNAAINPTTAKSNLDTMVAANSIGSVFVIEDTNEANTTTSSGNPVTNESVALAGNPSAMRTNITEFSSALRADSKYAPYALIAPSMNEGVDITSYVSGMGDLTQVGVSYGNYHGYPNKFTGGSAAGPIMSNWPSYATEDSRNTINWPGRTLLVTEWGTSITAYATASATDRGHLTVAGCVDTWQLGYAGQTVFDLNNWTSEDFNLFDNATPPNPTTAATYVHNFTSILLDPGSNATTFNPVPLAITASVPSGGFWFVLAFSDGKTYAVIFGDENALPSASTTHNWTFTINHNISANASGSGYPTPGVYDYSSGSPLSPVTTLGAQSAGYTTPIITTSGYYKTLILVLA